MPIRWTPEMDRVLFYTMLQVQPVSSDAQHKICEQWPLEEKPTFRALNQHIVKLAKLGAEAVSGMGVGVGVGMSPAADTTPATSPSKSAKSSTPSPMKRSPLKKGSKSPVKSGYSTTPSLGQTGSSEPGRGGGLGGSTTPSRRSKLYHSSSSRSGNGREEGRGEDTPGAEPARAHRSGWSPVNSPQTPTPSPRKRKRARTEDWEAEYHDAEFKELDEMLGLRATPKPKLEPSDRPEPSTLSGGTVVGHGTGWARGLPTGSASGVSSGGGSCGSGGSSGAHGPGQSHSGIVKAEPVDELEEMLRYDPGIGTGTSSPAQSPIRTPVLTPAASLAPDRSVGPLRRFVDFGLDHFQA